MQLYSRSRKEANGSGGKYGKIGGRHLYRDLMGDFFVQSFKRCHKNFTDYRLSIGKRL